MYLVGEKGDCKGDGHFHFFLKLCFLENTCEIGMLLPRLFFKFFFIIKYLSASKKKPTTFTFFSILANKIDSKLAGNCVRPEDSPLLKFLVTNVTTCAKTKRYRKRRLLKITRHISQT